MRNIFVGMGAAHRRDSDGLHSITGGVKYWQTSVIFVANRAELSIDCSGYDLAQHLHFLQEPFFQHQFVTFRRTVSTLTIRVSCKGV